MGVTGSSATGKMSTSLPELCQRVRKYAGRTPIAVGFGVNTREHFLSVGDLADGVVVGSKIVSLIKEAAPGMTEDAIRAYCKEVSKPRTHHELDSIRCVSLDEPLDVAKVDSALAPNATIPRPEEGRDGTAGELETLKTVSLNHKKEHEVILQIYSD